MEIENALYFHLGEPFRQHSMLEITSLKLFLYVEMRYELILMSLAAFEVCFTIRDIVNEFMPDFASCMMNFYGSLLCDFMFMSIYGVLTMIFRIGCI